MTEIEIRTFLNILKPPFLGEIKKSTANKADIIKNIKGEEL